MSVALCFYHETPTILLVSNREGESVFLGCNYSYVVVQHDVNRGFIYNMKVTFKCEIMLQVIKI